MKNKLIVAVFLIALLAVGVLPLLSACDEDIMPVEKTVKYSEFGAKGDGKTDDFAAICRAHDYANKNHVAVSADKGATYYIGYQDDDDKTHEKTAVIQTNTYWLDAKFIIDDKNIKNAKVKSTDIFTVKSERPAQKVEIPEGYTLKAGQRNVKLKFDEPMLLHLVNSDKKDFIRSGADQNKGSDRQEVILVNKFGYVDTDTPILWDYDKVTAITAYPATENRLKICGGEFVTIQAGTYLGYVARGLRVNRSNVLVYKVKHTVTDETESGSPYTGFYYAEKANDVTFEKCVMWGRLTPIRESGSTQGTYDISAKLANNVSWKDCTQANDLNYGWGIMGSNHSKTFR